jgi:hypothetical protein
MNEFRKAKWNEIFLKELGEHQSIFLLTILVNSVIIVFQIYLYSDGLFCELDFHHRNLLTSTLSFQLFSDNFWQ